MFFNLETIFKTSFKKHDLTFSLVKLEILVLFEMENTFSIVKLEVLVLFKMEKIKSCSQVELVMEVLR